MLIRKSFHFIRHGETIHNAQDICAGGQTDSPLSPIGMEQATSLREHLEDKKFDAIFASPLKRAVETAFHATGQTPEILEDLREWKLGDFEETPVDPFLTHIKTLPHHIPLPKGESREEFFNRSLTALNTILKKHNNPLIVAHGGTYWAILHAFQLPNQHIKNATCLHFEWQESLTITPIPNKT